VPLTLGAVAVSLVSRARPMTVFYRDERKQVHPLNAVEGDGLERAIALYFASEPTRKRTSGVEARWQLPTFSLAIAKMFASFFTLTSGAAGGSRGQRDLGGREHRGWTV